MFGGYDRAFPRGVGGLAVLFLYDRFPETAAAKEHELSRIRGAPDLQRDILSDLPLEELLEAHAASGREVTLAMRSQGAVMNVSIDAEGRVCDLRGLLGNPGVRRCCFTGIYAVEKAFLERLTPGKVESVVPVFVRMLAEQPGSVGAVLIDEGRWADIGSLEAYERIRPGVLGPCYGRQADGQTTVLRRWVAAASPRGMVRGRGRWSPSSPEPSATPGCGFALDPSATAVRSGLLPRHRPGNVPGPDAHNRVARRTIIMPDCGFLAGSACGSRHPRHDPEGVS
jgi:hypothetical protein